MGIFQRDERARTAVADDMLDDNLDETRRQLRDEVDVDPLVEEATARLREELRHLVARDEWGRELAWRFVARIALGPVLTRLRDQETTIRLLEATRNAPEIEAKRTADDDLLDALEVALEQAPAAAETVAVVEQPASAEAAAVEPMTIAEETQYRWL